MKRMITLTALACLLTATVAVAGTPGIEGRYLESRSCDVYVAACFANGEVGVTGYEGTMAWDVSRGDWNGVDLAGLKVVAVIQADYTLGDVSRHTYNTKSVLFVDERADEAQRTALVEFAKGMADGLIDEVVNVHATPISFGTKACTNDGCATVKAGDVLEVSTRCLHEKDKHCGNETAWYPPLTKIDDARMAFAERDRFSGTDLGVTWDTDVRASAYLGTFTR